MPEETKPDPRDLQPPLNAKEVTKDQFFEAIGRLDVHPTPTGSWPYLSVFKTRAGFVRGWIKCHRINPNGNRFYLPP